jgi:DNA-directed RNA polymerase subunit E'/Rpb7
MPIVEKILETTIDLFGNDIYTLNINAMLMKMLSLRYKGKCFQSMLIMSINKIIKYSQIYLVDNRLDGAAYINVQFEVSGLVLIKGEVIHGCRAVEINNSGVIVDSETVGGLLHNNTKNNIINIIKKDQFVPVIVELARYTPNQNKITIRGTPYIPIVQPDVFYNITEPTSLEDMSKLDLLLKDLSEEMKIHNELMTKNEKPYDYFKEIMYPYKTVQKFKQTNIGASFSEMKLNSAVITDINQGCIVSPQAAQKEKELALFYSDTYLNGKDVLVIKSTLYSAIADIINRRLLYLRNLSGFVKYYETPKQIQDMIVYWRSCIMSKE